MAIIRIGLDTSKYVFQVHGVDEQEQPSLRRQLPRGQMERFFAKLPATRIGLEACGASHHWGRVLRRRAVPSVLSSLLRLPLETLFQVEERAPFLSAKEKS